MSFELIGSGFDDIPNDAIGVSAIDNDNPLEFLQNTNPSGLVSIAEKTQNRMTFTQSTEYVHTYGAYLGAIVSADRNTIYWVNNTKPLP